MYCCAQNLRIEGGTVSEEKDLAREQLAELFGESAKVAVPLGSVVRFRRDGRERSGKLLHVIPPGTTAGRGHGMILVVDEDKGGFPTNVRLDEVVM